MLQSLSFNNVRNLKQTEITFGSKFNVFYGENGSGKTSAIEGIYLLSCGKSFRTHKIKNIIRKEQAALMLVGRLRFNDINYVIGIEKSQTKTTIRINGGNVKKASELVEILPVIVIEQDSHKLLESGPEWRRKYIDWGLFHVEHSFLNVWIDYRKTLRQKNVALQNQSSIFELETWNQSLARYGEILTLKRFEYVQQIKPIFQCFANELLGNGEYELKYMKGWVGGSSLYEKLQAHTQRDLKTGRTSVGPHRADMPIFIDSNDTRDFVSRGQQKLLVYALKLAQVDLLKKQTDKSTLLLLDDLGSELDSVHINKLLSLIESSFGQVCITTANLDLLPLKSLSKVKLFHVEHGIIEALNQMSRT